jgi:hypothetical protein
MAATGGAITPEQIKANLEKIPPADPFVAGGAPFSEQSRMRVFGGLFLLV